MPLQQELTQKLSHLQNLLCEMNALFEWARFKEMENAGHPTKSSLIDDDLSEQFSNQYAQFLSGTVEIDRLLKNGSQLTKRSFFLNKLRTLQAQFYYLGTGVRVY